MYILDIPNPNFLKSTLFFTTSPLLNGIATTTVIILFYKPLLVFWTQEKTPLLIFTYTFPVSCLLSLIIGCNFKKSSSKD